MTLNVFGRTLMTNGNGTAANGRGHNPNHHVAVTIGKPFKGGVMGGCGPVAHDYGATGINAASGASSSSSADILPVETLGAFAQTMLSAVGGDPTVITTGQVVTAALA